MPSPRVCPYQHACPYANECPLTDRYQRRTIERLMRLREAEATASMTRAVRIRAATQRWKDTAAQALADAEAAATKLMETMDTTDISILDITAKILKQHKLLCVLMNIIHVCGMLTEYN